MEKGKINWDEFQEKTYQCSIEKKTRDYFTNIQPKIFHMLYKRNDLSNNFDVILATSCKIRIYTEIQAECY